MQLQSPAKASSAPQQYLTFMLGGDTYAFGILAIKEIIEYTELAKVPSLPDCISGVINLRGAVVPVMDMMARFGRPSSPVGKRTCIVIVEVDSGQGKQVLGLIVDAVNAVLDIPASEIEAPPSVGAKAPNSLIEGMGKVNGKFVILLDVARVLALDTIAALEQGLHGEQLLA